MGLPPAPPALLSVRPPGFIETPKDGTTKFSALHHLWISTDSAGSSLTSYRLPAADRSAKGPQEQEETEGEAPPEIEIHAILVVDVQYGEYADSSRGRLYPSIDLRPSRLSPLPNLLHALVRLLRWLDRYPPLPLHSCVPQTRFDACGVEADRSCSHPRPYHLTCPPPRPLSLKTRTAAHRTRSRKKSDTRCHR